MTAPGAGAWGTGRHCPARPSHRAGLPPALRRRLTWQLTQQLLPSPLCPPQREMLSPRAPFGSSHRTGSRPMLRQRRLLGGAPLLDLAPVFPPGTRSWLGRHTAAKPARGRGSGGPGGRHEQSPPCLGASSNCTATCHPVQSPPAPRHGHGGYNSHKTGQLRPREVKRRSPAPRP